MIEIIDKKPDMVLCKYLDEIQFKAPRRWRGG